MYYKGIYRFSYIKVEAICANYNVYDVGGKNVYGNDFRIFLWIKLNIIKPVQKHKCTVT